MMIRSAAAVRVASRPRQLTKGATHSGSYNTLQDYEPPSWAKDLACQPASYVQLASRPTPIHTWSLPGVPSGFKVSVKRDDMTGSVLSGNKVRKLEFLFADALQKGCDSVITCGGIQSNHARTTAVAARQLGLQPHLVLRWSGNIDPGAVDCTGNVLLDRCVGSKIVLIPPLKYDGEIVDEKLQKGVKHIMEDYSDLIRSQGAVPYLIPVGGSNTVGAWGYIEAFSELQEQGVLESYDDIVVAVGSGGTAFGLAVGNYLTGSKLKIHAVCVCDDASYFHGHIDETLELMGITVNSEGKPLRSQDLIDIIEGHKGRGYGLSTQEELDQLLDIFTTTGVSVDPVYTLKGVRGMLSELKTNPGRFAGKRILYIHTGGVFGLYDGRIDQLLKNSQSTNQIFSYKDIFSAGD